MSYEELSDWFFCPTGKLEHGRKNMAAPNGGNEGCTFVFELCHGSIVPLFVVYDKSLYHT
jgi:hypothetical protein